MRFFQPPTGMRRYFTTFYLMEASVADGERVTDYLHPEWGNLRFHSGDVPDASVEGGMAISGSAFAATGPSSKAVHFTIGSTRMWGMGLLPLGWAKFVGISAASLANGVFDGNSHPAFASFEPLAASIFGNERDIEGELARITAHFAARLSEPVADEARITAIHAALIDPDAASVADIVARAAVGQRTVERICNRAFGFSPKLLLRRQRFMRSLMHFMLDPSLRWIGAIDGHYHDQAQFVRDFREFMGMTPREYAALDKPILGAIVKERARFAGAAAQALDGPAGGGKE